MGSPLLAIDIGSSSIKAVELSGAKGPRKLTALGMELVPNGAIQDGVVQDEAAVSDILRELIGRMNIPSFGHRVALSISGSAVQVAKIVVDSTNGSLEEQMPFIAEQYFKADLSSVYFQYYVMGRAKHDPAFLDVVMAAVSREVVEQYIGLLQSAGYNTGLIDCDVFCLSNMLEYTFPLKGTRVAVLNVGSENSQLVVLENGRYQFSSEIKFGGSNYTQRIADTMGIETESAEVMKLSAHHGVGVTEELTQLITDVNTQFINEIAEAFTAYFSTQSEGGEAVKFDRVFLTGGGSKLMGLDVLLADRIQVPVQALNPFHKVKMGGRKFDGKYIVNQGHLYGVAIGLGLRQFKDNIKK